MASKVCPTCHKHYSELNNYCMYCGIEQEKEPNKCTEQKTVLCSHISLPDDAIYCPKCGSLTTYGLERKHREEEFPVYGGK